VVRGLVPQPYAATDPGVAGHSQWQHTLVCAPTGSGKTLTAFLSSLDTLVTPPPAGAEPVDPKARTQVLYLSPLRALASTWRRTSGHRSPASRSLPSGSASPMSTVPTVGDAHRRHPGRRAPQAGPPPAGPAHHHARVAVPDAHLAARETLVNVEAVIIDEIHALAATKRGAPRPHPGAPGRGLRPPAAAHRAVRHAAPAGGDRHFLGGFDRPVDAAGADPGRRPVRSSTPASASRSSSRWSSRWRTWAAIGEVIDESGGSAQRPLRPAGAGAAARSGPAMHPRLLELVLEHRSTIIFVNARRLAERLATRLNELAGRAAAADPSRGWVEARRQRRRPTRAGQGAPRVAVARARLLIEDELKSGGCGPRWPPARSSSASTWARSTWSSRSSRRARCRRGLQRIGRAGHQVGEPSRGHRIFPKHRSRPGRGRRGHASACTTGLIEHTRYPRNPLDVLAQQIVAACARSTSGP
jgi:ATP-dependent Lhr-like helicase